jgi:hypothetical protein
VAQARATPLSQARQSAAVTVLSFGGGQDSHALLYMLLYDAEFRAHCAPGRLVVVISDTGDEHPETYRHVRLAQDLCKARGVEFVHITSDQGFHPRTWPSLRGHYRATSTVGSKAYPKTCTSNLKIVPIYKWMEAWLATNYGVKTGRRRGFYEFAEKHGPIRVLLGIAAGEEKRVSRDLAKEPKWMRATIEKVYPLIDLGMDRQACQDYIRGLGHEVPPPSNCMLCPFMSEIELLWLFRHHPADYLDWVNIEQQKLTKWAHLIPADQNFGVWGRKTLPTKLAEATARYGHMTNAELTDYKMSHGHCVQSKY